MFAGDVESVSDTKIYVGRDGDRQLTVYQMEVQLTGGATNAMVLPVPAKADTIELVDLSGAREFFKKLDKVFPRRRSRSLGMGGAAAAGFDSLEVHQVGDYDVSIAPTAADLERVNAGVFTLSKVVKHVLGKHYDGFAFVVCRLSPNRFSSSGGIHPIAYTHSMEEHPGQLFVPTRHVHGGNLTEYLQSLKTGGTKPEWDHSIYAQGEGELLDQPAPFPSDHRRARPGDMNLSAWADLKKDLPIDLLPFFAGVNMHKFDFKGQLDNVDIRVAA